MRKLRPAEVIALTAALSLGAAASAEDFEELPITQMHTVNVNMSYQIPTMYFYFTSVGVPAGTLGSGGARTQVGPSDAKKAKAKACADAYSFYKKPSIYTINYSNKFSFEREYVENGITKTENQYRNTNTPPGPPGPWAWITGTTITKGTAPKVHQITIYAAGYETFDEHFKTLAHEYGHANGHVGDGSHAMLEQAAEDALAAYKNDNGAKCGGLAAPY